MAGTVRGSIEHLVSTFGVDNPRDIFHYMINFFDTHPNWTRISSNFGGGTGFGPSAGPNPSGNNAWAVYQKGGSNPYFICLQWSWNTTFGSGPGSPGDHPQNYWIGIQVAFDTSGSTNIWNGTTNNNGLDTKGTPCWVAGAGDLVVFPRSNGTGGAFATNKQAFASVTNNSLTHKFHLLADDDYIFYAHDQGNNGSYEHCMYIGPFTPAPGVTITGPPLCMTSYGGSIDNLNQGDLNNNAAFNDGGVADASGNNGARIFFLTWIEDLFIANLQPNGQRGVSSFDLQDIQICLNDPEGLGSYGWLGSLTYVKSCFGVASNDTNGALTKVVLGSSGNDNVKWVVDWDGATLPGSGTTAAGVQF